METEPEMVQTLEFIDKDFIGAIRNQLKNVKENISIMNEKIGSLCRGIYRVGQKWAYSCDCMEQSLFLYYYLLIIVLFFI